MERPDREAARVLACHPEQGWSLLCNGVILFDDTGELLPDGRVVIPHRGGSRAFGDVVERARRAAAEGCCAANIA